jgi:hypothetical protein
LLDIDWDSIAGVITLNLGNALVSDSAAAEDD